jgi:hypothetical protein
LILYGWWRKEMKTETVLKVEVIDLLIKTFWVLETERFITSIKRNNFDYTNGIKNYGRIKV